MSPVNPAPVLREGWSVEVSEMPMEKGAAPHLLQGPALGVMLDAARLGPAGLSYSFQSCGTVVSFPKAAPYDGSILEHPATSSSLPLLRSSSRGSTHPGCKHRYRPLAPHTPDRSCIGASDSSPAEPSLLALSTPGWCHITALTTRPLCQRDRA